MERQVTEKSAKNLQRHFTDGAIAELTFAVGAIRVARENGFLTAKVQLSNITSSNQTLYYRFAWLGADGGMETRLGPPHDIAIDTLAISRQKFPGSPASLDALCRRLGVDNSAREKHGALLDSEILAEVYLELIGGRQPDFTLNQTSSERKTAETNWRPAPRSIIRR